MLTVAAGGYIELRTLLAKGALRWYRHDMAAPRMTLPTQAVLRALLAEPATERYGLELCQLTGLPAGTIYPILTRLEVQYGWLVSRWEDQDADNPSRPRRRYVRLTEDGADGARHALAAAATSKTAARLRPAINTDGQWAW